MFKYLLLLCLLTAIVVADDADKSNKDKEAEVKDAYNYNDGFGHFKYGHDISNGVQARAEGNQNVVRGEYFYIDEKGDKIKVTYVADTTGFHPIIGAPS